MERISIHALLAESDQHLCICVIELIHFYPRSPCGERPRPQPPKARVLYFYPRSPCGERRVKRFHAADISYFYPRSPCGERQAANGLAHAPPEISIHALLAESDCKMAARRGQLWNFYPRSPCGERRQSRNSQNINRGFLSTLSLRRATGLDGRFKL